MKNMYLLVTVTFLAFTQTVFAERKIFLGSTFDHEGDSLNGKIITVESIVDDEAIGPVAYLLVREVQDGKIILSYTITVREGNIFSVSFTSKIFGIGESGSLKKNWKILEIDGEAITAEIIADIPPERQADPNQL